MIKPGIIALILIALMAFSLGIQMNRSKTILEDAYSQVFVIACPNERTYGTGWWLNDEGYAITAYHVVAGCTKKLAVRSPWVANVTVVAYDPILDIALLKVDDKPDWAKGLPLSPKLAIGDDVYVVGYPIQLYLETNKSIDDMSRIPRVQKATVTWINPDKKVFEFSPGTDAGNSGGPIVSMESGGVVGIVVYARSGVVSEGYYGLRMDGIAQFLSEHNVHYRVVDYSLASYIAYGMIAGFLAILALGFLRVKSHEG